MPTSPHKMAASMNWRTKRSLYSIVVLTSAGCAAGRFGSRRGMEEVVSGIAIRILDVEEGDRLPLAATRLLARHLRSGTTAGVGQRDK